MTHTQRALSSTKLTWSDHRLAVMVGILPGDKALEALVGRMTWEHRSWGCDRIHDRDGHTARPFTVSLRRHRGDTGPTATTVAVSGDVGGVVGARGGAHPPSPESTLQ